MLRHVPRPPGFWHAGRLHVVHDADDRRLEGQVPVASAGHARRLAESHDDVLADARTEGICRHDRRHLARRRIVRVILREPGKGADRRDLARIEAMEERGIVVEHGTDYTAIIPELP